MKQLLYIGILFITIVACSCSNTQQTELKVMSFNIRYDNPEDSIQGWNFRKDNVVKMIRFHDVDIIGMQEVLHNQLMDLKERLPQYDFVGVAREDGKEDGEYSPVFYRKDKYRKVDGGTFWLSETPEAPSFGWDAACRRITTWVILKEQNSNKEIAFFNTHFDHVGKVARKKSAALLLTQVQQLAENRAVIVTGDFNVTRDSETIKIMTDPTGEFSLNNCNELAELTYGPDWTFHDFGSIPYSKRQMIDFVFSSQSGGIEKYAVLSEDIDGVYLSDHCPVFVQLGIK
ncbi:endonuclease/exonuclease/phosphatase family protein [Draconibacterium orientale]|uniref:endonuclease/exonuclease/phosphatase family protein n=1 Tax=Draconibacterium orientale TaxID=1168034 RepID=UPI002A0A643D|nr:endonuclease/exonuclease/phosphatase family protein [Draconibacterium orientale]